jgi:hypothetical protein
MIQGLKIQTLCESNLEINSSIGINKECLLTDLELPACSLSFHIPCFSFNSAILAGGRMRPFGILQGSGGKITNLKKLCTAAGAYNLAYV